MPTPTGGTGSFGVGALRVTKLGWSLAQGSGAPVDGTSGTLAGKAGLNCEYIDRVSGYSWINIGTKASPRWSVIAFTQRFAISSANILGMNAAPVALLAAPGANRMYVVSDIVFVMTTTATGYANGGTVQFQLHGTSVLVHSGTIPAAVVTAGAGTDIRVLGAATAANGTDYGTVSAANVGIDITNNTAPFITGTGTAVVYISFSIVPTN